MNEEKTKTDNKKSIEGIVVSFRHSKLLIKTEKGKLLHITYPEMGVFFDFEKVIKQGKKIRVYYTEKRFPDGSLHYYKGYPEIDVLS